MSLDVRSSADRASTSAHVGDRAFYLQALWGFWGAGCEDLYRTDSYADPLAHDDDNWYEELADASGLDTSPDTGLVSPPTVATEEGASFAMVIRRAAEVLDLQLPPVEVKMNVLTEVLQPGLSHSEPLLSFNEGLTCPARGLGQALYRHSCTQDHCTPPPSPHSRGSSVPHPTPHP